MAILRAERCRVDLNFLYEGGVDSDADPSVSTVIDTQAPKGRIVEQNAVRDISVFKPRPAGYGWIQQSGSNTAHYARAHIEDACDATTKGKVRVLRVRDVSGYRSALAFNRDGCGDDLDRLGDGA